MLSDVSPDSSGVLEGEQLVRGTSIRGNWWRYEEPVVFPNCECRARLNPSRLRPIITTPSGNPASGVPFDDWAVLSHPSSHSINIQIYSAQRPHGSTDLVRFNALNTLHKPTHQFLTQDLPPPPPTSEEPEYQVLYTSINTLNDDILLSIFSRYLPGARNNWKLRLGWFELAHVCRRWRRLIYESAFHLDAHILCTKGAPVVDTLSLLPPLPLVIDYQFTTIRVRDELGISHVLRLRSRVRRINLRVPPSSLRKLLVLMNEPFPRLEHLSLSSTINENMALTLPETFLAPNLRHLNLLGVNLSSELLLLSSTASLVTLTLTNIRDSGYCLPKHLITRLRSFRQLEELSIGFTKPLPHPSAESEILDALETPVTLPKLKRFTFSGDSAYLESLVAQISAPLLERLNITLFNQIAFALPHLSHFTNTAEGPKLPITKIIFERDTVAVVMDHRRPHFGYRSFSLRVMCRVVNRQIDRAAQICSALRPMLSGAEKLALVDGLRMPTDWQRGVIDSAMWHKLLRPFIGVKTLHICRTLRRELARALQVGDAGLDPGLLPSLQELACDGYTDNLFTPFIRTRQIVGRPVRLSAPPRRPLPPPMSARHFQLPDPSMMSLLTQRIWRPVWLEPHFSVPHVPPVQLKRYLPVPYVPPVRVEQDSPPPFRTARPVRGSVKIQLPPPKHIRCRIRPSHKGGSSWR